MPKKTKTTQRKSVVRKFKDTRQIEVLDPEDYGAGAGFGWRAERGFGRCAVVLTDFGSGEVVRF